MAYSFLSSATTTSTANPRTTTITIGATASLVIAHIAFTNNTIFGTPVTCDGVDMTIVNTATSAEGSVAMWYIQNGDINTGASKVISIPNTSSDEITLSVSVYAVGASKDSSYHKQGTNTTGGATTLGVTLTTVAANSLQVDTFFSGYGTLTGFNFGKTAIFSKDNGNEINASQYNIQATSTNVSMSYRWGGSDDANMVAASFTEIDGASGNLNEHDTVAFANIDTQDATAIANIESIDGVLTGN